MIRIKHFDILIISQNATEIKAKSRLSFETAFIIII